MRKSLVLVALGSVSAFLLAGCAAAAAPEARSGTDGSSGSDSSLEAAWLDNGRFFSVITYGSSSCVPVVDTVEAEGQHVTVTFAAPQDSVCTMDYVPRASLAGLPAGVDPTQDVTVTLIDPAVSDATPNVVLHGQASLTGKGGEPTDYLPSAGWYSPNGVVLMSWGSGSCPPIVDQIDEFERAATVTFAEHDGPCTMDMRPRTTLLAFDTEFSPNDLALTLQGEGYAEPLTLQPIEN